MTSDDSNITGVRSPSIAGESESPPESKPPGKAESIPPVQAPPIITPPIATPPPAPALSLANSPVSRPPNAPFATPPKAATWQNNEPKESWCPTEFKEHLPYVSVFNYDNDKSQEQIGITGWKLLAATRRGRMHAHDGTHREDAFAIEVGDNFVIACVSDGAGAYKYSRVGSETTCREVSSRLRVFLTEQKENIVGLEEPALKQKIEAAMADAVAGTCAFLHDLAVKVKCEPKDLRCTLLIALLIETPKAAILLASQVGDGFPAGLDRDGKASRYGASDSGEFSGEVNCFIPDLDAPAKASKIMTINPPSTECLLLCTDGIEDPFYPVEKKAGQIFQQLYCGVEQQLDGFRSQKTHGPIVGHTGATQLLADWLSFEKQGENDDRTILVLHRDPPNVNRTQINSG